ncbi:ABC transporter permease [Acetivibrio clariflavus]|uniref:ABC-type nitrate/sulfonate/bicarbonate transport system, permease component n=1 Tax=Acetivibrio clariflavus (strain DSM 19732 / NBRC 101661 / EBR45) TaxID=720554 RepID=G8LZN9_ACECE|nr:ABC transporter permease [Acetivibrio clariflavus]AEV67940.1 ABC-type nitrate/sulfonate/bicarbonate transport system, permease component [Acetivibrio clariflavus DSM 19732]
MGTKALQALKDLSMKSAAIILFILLWETAPRIGMVDRMYLPPFSEVITALVKLIISGDLFIHIGSSLKRSMGGLFLAVAIGIPLGIFIGWFKSIEKFLDPLLQIFRNTSTLALFPVFILLFGLGELSKVAIIFWGTLWATLLNTINGVKNIDPLLIKAAQSMSASNFFIFRKIVLPAATPSIITGFRLSASTSILILVAAEMLGSNSGLGFLIFYSEQKYDIAEMYSGILTISVLGLLINYLIVAFERRLLVWKKAE